MRKNKKTILKLTFSVIVLTLVLTAAKTNQTENPLAGVYESRFNAFSQNLKTLLRTEKSDMGQYKLLLHEARVNMKLLDFWWRYSRPLEYKSINGPLPVEWETEVFEKYERPYKRIGAGLTLAEQALDDGDTGEINRLLSSSFSVLSHLQTDSMLKDFNHPGEFYFANRLFILNLSAIYTTGFECPDTGRIIPELKAMCKAMTEVYQAFNLTYPTEATGADYLNLYQAMLGYLQTSTDHYSGFNHFEFLKSYLNPLYAANAAIIRQRMYRSRNLQNYSLNSKANSIFDKNIYTAQYAKGLFGRIEDPKLLSEIDALGHQLFFDPLLSGNNERSCASCHVPGMFYTDTGRRTSEKFSHNGFLKRNTPSTINADLNHLLMADGRHLTLQEQALAVISNPDEMGSELKDVMKKIMSCKEYADKLKKLAALTPQQPEPSIDHVVSAITFHYASFSRFYSDFDRAINSDAPLNAMAKNGFNLFMSRAQCATCHFVPQFNGVKPPFIGSEFEVLGVPENKDYKTLSQDTGRSVVNPATETRRAFRTGTLRNIAKTGPYMHNGVFGNLREVIEFYNNGGGAGKGIDPGNQTLSGEKLGLTAYDIQCLIAFMESLNEDVVIPPPPTLPLSRKKEYNKRKTGGIY